MREVDEQQLALARHYRDIGQPRRVLETLDAGVDLENPEAWALRGEALYLLDRYVEGVEAGRKGLALDSQDPILLDVLALNLIELDELAEAESALLAALEGWPEDVTLLCHYALACARGGQFEKARLLVERAAGHEPQALEVMTSRAQVAWLSGDKQAQEYADAVLRIEPQNRIAHMVRANLRAERSDVHGAVRHLQEAVRLDPTDADTAHVARYNKSLTHWSQWPVYPFVRFGPLKVWAAYLVVFLFASATGMWSVGLPLALLYVALVVYAWTIAPLALRWVERRS